MGAGTLNMVESCRPWHASGLHYIYQPDLSKDWPPGWDALWSKTSPAKTVWTYAELGNDMGDQPDSARRDALVSLIQSLGWPKGCISFWPLGLAQEAVKPWLFWRGVQRIGAQTVLVYGEDAANFLHLCWQEGKKIFRGDTVILTYKSLIECASSPQFPEILKSALEGRCP